MQKCRGSLRTHQPQGLYKRPLTKCFKEFALNKLVLRRRTLLLSGSALAAPMIASGIARAADNWPNKPVKYINLFPAGGPTDVLSRIACQKLSELTGQQFVVENKGGSGGNVGADAIAHSAPDGYTIGLMSVSSHAIAPSLYSKLPFNADKDFTRSPCCGRCRTC